MGNVLYPGLLTMDFNLQKPLALQTLPIPQLNFNNFSPPNIPYNWKDAWNLRKTNLERNYIATKDLKLENNNQQLYKPSIKDLTTVAGINALSTQLSGLVSDQIFGDSDIERGMANLFSSGISSVGNTFADNILKGEILTQGLGQNLEASLKGSGIGIGANLVGQGINSIGGNSKLSRGIGQGVATGLANISGIVNGVKQLGAISKTAKATKLAMDVAKASKNAGDYAKGLNTLSGLKDLSKAAKWNLAGIGALAIGSGMSAALGPSKEYGGTYGGITQGMDLAYDLIGTGASFVPGVGTAISVGMALNKGLSNLFGSTDGMTKLDAILGSAFMPAPIKWLNMAGANTTQTFNNLSWQNSEKAQSFMGNAFGNLLDKFDTARKEAGKTYGTFSGGAYAKARDNIMFANNAWDLIMRMADQNTILNIRSIDMSSINNLRYAQNIQGGWNSVARGRYGMKIFNNATNHNIGLRLLSGAALIDNKQMILCSVVD